ncbi:hypothetical protein DICPUDRAFT_44151, partial [Dictyostelium purpureum]
LYKMNIFKTIIFSLLLFKYINCLSKKDFIFYSIKIDDRDCPYPQCGGYWLSRVNTGQSPIYVSSISLDPSIINYNISLITLALTDDLLLGGLILSHPKFQYFQVHNATRLIYNNGADKIYGVPNYNREYQYITISESTPNVASIIDSKNYVNNPYHPFTAETINLSFQYKLLSFKEMYSKTINHLDINWLHKQITNSKTINYGFIDKQKKTFSITKIFIEIPFSGYNSEIEKCREKKNFDNQYIVNNGIEDLKDFINETICASQPTSIPTYHRDSSKCIFYSGCISNNTLDLENNCQNENIKCPHGYTLVYIPIRPFGCYRYYCVCMTLICFISIDLLLIFNIFIFRMLIFYYKNYFLEPI